MRSALENILRNWMTAVPTVLVMAIILTMFHALLIIHAKAQETMRSVAQKFTITVYLKSAADPLEVGNLITTLQARPDVISPVVYTSQEAAWETVSKNFALDPTLLKKYKFSLPASLTITPRQPQNASAIEDFLQQEAPHLLQDPLATKDPQKNITRQIVAFLQQVENATSRTLLFFIILFVIGGTLMLSSTIHLAVSTRQREMHIMKFVGASFGKITTPFVIEGLILAIIAFLVHLVLLTGLPFEIDDQRLQLNALLAEFTALFLLSGVVSYATATFHLRKKYSFN